MNQGNEKNRFRDPKHLINEQLLLQIPSDPTESEVTEVLAKSPAVMSYIQNLLIDLKKEISMKKLILEQKQNQLERLMADVRMQTINNYRAELQARLNKEPQEIMNLCKNYKMTKAEAKEIVKNKRPEKPTASDLKDVAILRTRQFYENEILPLKQQIIESEKNYDMWKGKYNLFENNFKASQSIKGLLQNEKYIGGGS